MIDTGIKSKEDISSSIIKVGEKVQSLCPPIQITTPHRHMPNSNAGTLAGVLQQVLEEICRCHVCEESIKAAFAGTQYLFPAVSLSEDQSPVKYEGILLHCWACQENRCLYQLSANTLTKTQWMQMHCVYTDPRGNLSGASHPL